MKEIKKEERNENLIQELLKVWENSVRATHKFLSNEEILEIKKYVPEALASISHLIIDNDENGNQKMLSYGIESYGVTNLAVNEDNPQAKEFYEYMGFKVYQRKELDDQGNPYPVLYMKLDR